MKYASVFRTYVSAAVLSIGLGAGCGVDVPARESSDVAPAPGPRSASPRGKDGLEQIIDDVGRDAPGVDAPDTPPDDGADATPDGEADADTDTPADPPVGDAPKLKPITNIDAAGPYEVTIEQSAGPNRGWIARPKNLGEGGFKHPVFSWGCGGGSQPSQYRDHLTRWASHGFVVEAHVSTGNARDHTVVFDWVTSENNRQGSAYFGKLDPTKIAAGGHSMGSVATFAAASDPRLSTTIHVAGGSFDGNGHRTLKKPTAYIAGANDQLGATQNAERDYRNTSNVPVFFTVMTGVDHIQAARAALAPITAWLRWHIAGETERKAQFIGAGCEFCKGKYKSQSKGWD